MHGPMSRSAHSQDTSVTLESLRQRLLTVVTDAELADTFAILDRLDACSLVDQFPELIYVKDRRSRFVLANDATARANNIAHPVEMLGKTDFDLFERDVAEELFLAEQRMMSLGEAMTNVEHRLAFGGMSCWLQSTKTPLRDAEGRIVGLIGISRDITERKRQEDLRRGHARLLEMIARGQPLDKVLLSLVDLVEEELDDVVASVLLLDEGTDRLRHGASSSLPEAYVRMIDGLLIGPHAGSCGTAAWRREPVIVSNALEDALWEDYRELPQQFGFRSCWSTPIIGPDRRVLGTFALYSGSVREPTELELELTAMATDIAGIAIERMRAEERIRYMAHHDALTGLPNRALFWIQFNHILAEARREKRKVAVAYIDLDNFKQINDRLGHAAGDEVLKTIAERLPRCIRANDLIVRLGGDEFAIVFSLIGQGEEGVVRRMDELRAVISAPVMFESEEVHVTCSMGAAFYPEDGDTPEALLARADRAMYGAKNDGRDRLQVWTYAPASD
nr:sensor domain-containing diguanylate cyclase [Pseudorhizobium flavum]